MKQIFRDKYVIYGLINGRIANINLTELEDIKDYLHNELGFGVRGRFKFENETRKKDVSYDKQDNPVFTDTLIGLFEQEEFSKGNTMLTVMKLRYYSPFSNMLEEDEYVYYIEDPDLKATKNATYFISDLGRVFKMSNTQTKVTELKIEVEKQRIELKGHKYKIEYLLNKKGNRYKF